MTTIRAEEIRCAVCGTVHQYTVLSSTNAMGSWDIDGRPPEMMRSTISLWVQRCPSCGYCAPDVSAAPDGVFEVIESEEYQRQLVDPGLPTLANTFLCLSMIEEHLGHYADAAQASLRAAWACDDAHHEEGARRCRLRAAELLQRALDHGWCADRAGVEEALLADIMRRAGEFESALSVCEAGMAKDLDEVMRGVLQYEKVLIARHDTACHTVDEALDWYKKDVQSDQ